jgi:hypothetical protein
MRPSATSRERRSNSVAHAVGLESRSSVDIQHQTLSQWPSTLSQLRNRPGKQLHVLERPRSKEIGDERILRLAYGSDTEVGGLCDSPDKLQRMANEERRARLRLGGGRLPVIYPVIYPLTLYSLWI